LGRRKQAVRMEYGYDAIARVVAAPYWYHLEEGWIMCH
jgi:hypothetical protein